MKAGGKGCSERGMERFRRVPLFGGLRDGAGEAKRPMRRLAFPKVLRGDFGGEVVSHYQDVEAALEKSGDGVGRSADDGFAL